MAIHIVDARIAFAAGFSPSGWKKSKIKINANGPETKPIFFGVMDIFVSKNNIFCCYSCFNPY